MVGELSAPSAQSGLRPLLGFVLQLVHLACTMLMLVFALRAHDDKPLLPARMPANTFSRYYQARLDSASEQADTESEPARIRAFFANRRIALTGVSTDPNHFRRAVMRALTREGMTVVPVHRSADTIEDGCTYASIEEVTPSLRAALIMTPSRSSQRVVEECARRNQTGMAASWRWARRGEWSCHRGGAAPSSRVGHRSLPAHVLRPSRDGHSPRTCCAAKTDGPLSEDSQQGPLTSFCRRSLQASAISPGSPVLAQARARLLRRRRTAHGKARRGANQLRRHGASAQLLRR